jgi:hypothetical protein
MNHSMLVCCFYLSFVSVLLAAPIRVSDDLQYLTTATTASAATAATTTTNNNNNQPQQIHLNIQGPNTFAVSWATVSPITSPTVEWSVLQTNSLPILHSKKRISTTTSSPSKIYHYNKYISPWFHKVVIQDVPNDSIIEYRCGSGEGNHWSPLYTFHTTPSKQHQLTSLIVVGDLGQSSNTKYVLSSIESLMKVEKQHAMLNLGDLSYAECDQKKWDSWGHIMSGITTQLPMMVIQGNHDVEYMSKY